MSGKECLNCGNVNPAHAKFCLECGSGLSQVAAAKDRSVRPELNIPFDVPASLRDGLRALESIMSCAKNHPSMIGGEEAEVVLTAADFQSVLKPENAAKNDDAVRRRIGELYTYGWIGLLRTSIQGHSFVPMTRIKERFGSTLQENYPEANASFLSFAIGYWTFKLLLIDMRQDAPDATLTQLFSQLEDDTAVLFFPTPGPASIPAKQREKTQREILAQCAPELDLDDFMRGNPILLRDRSKGWLSKLFG